MNALTKKQDITFSLPAISADKINPATVKRVNDALPELAEKTRAFDRQNSQTTLSLITLTMMTGHSPYRMMRQVMAEVEKRKMALAEAQVRHAEMLEKIEELEAKSDAVSAAKLRLQLVALDVSENKINGSLKDIATLIDAYENIKAANDIDDWDEEAFEREEKKHHVRRGFELLYRNLVNSRSAEKSSIEYLQQYGVHPQVAIKECWIYINGVNEAIENGRVLHSNHLEEFLDEMASKYVICVDGTSERIFGKKEYINPDYMVRIGKD